MSTAQSQSAASSPLPFNVVPTAPLRQPQAPLVRTPNPGPHAVSANRIELTAGEFHFDARDVGFREGALTAIVGPNGSGKSTLVETLLGFRTARIEDARILGVPARQFMNDVARLRRLGTQLQRVEYPDHSLVDEIVALHRVLYRKQNPAIGSALGIDELGKKPYRGLSKGQRQRVDLFMAMAHMPDLMILDEPFTGLDKTYAGRVVELLTGTFGGATLIMICHSGEELAAAGDVLWIHDGSIRYSGNRQALKERLVGNYRASMYLENDAQANWVRARLAGDPSVARISQAPQTLQIHAFGGEGLGALVRGLMDAAKVRHFEFAPTDDSDLLRTCTQGALDV